MAIPILVTNSPRLLQIFFFPFTETESLGSFTASKKPQPKMSN
jgi:hypothetical protein